MSNINDLIWAGGVSTINILCDDVYKLIRTRKFVQEKYNLKITIFLKLSIT